MSARTTQTTPHSKSDVAGAHRIVVLRGAHVGLARALGAMQVRIGREAAAPSDLELDDVEASRDHCVIEPNEDGALVMRDLGSRNGTFVDGERIEEAIVADGSIVRIGSHVLLVQYVTLGGADLISGERDSARSLLGSSIEMLRLRAQIRELGPLADPVLVQGETGTGKELVARELHVASGRAGPFVPVNCAALPEALVESELFGHVRGAFTGATVPSLGLFGAAEGGTILLDEIGEMQPAIQAKLLRALATGEVRAVGEARARHADVRVLAATNVDLAHAVSEGRFRADLHARLGAAVVQVPPLRARREDVLPLFVRFAGGLEPTADAAEALLLHAWPYNVRELEHVARTAAHAARRGACVELAHLPMPLQRAISSRHAASGAPSQSVPATLPIELRVPRGRPPTADELREVIAHFDGNMAKVASFFGKDRQQVYRWARRFGIDLRAFRSEVPE